jgi:hypothetical protein
MQDEAEMHESMPESGPESGKDRNPGVGRLLGYWYLCIGLAFVALGLRNLLAGAPAWTVALRWIVALGFIVLGAGNLEFAKAKPKSGGNHRASAG